MASDGLGETEGRKVKPYISATVLLSVLLLAGCNDSVSLYDHHGNKTATTIYKKDVPIEHVVISGISGSRERFVEYRDQRAGIDGLVRLDDLVPKEKKAPITYTLSSNVLMKQVNGRRYEVPKLDEVETSNTGEYLYFRYTDFDPYKWDWEIEGTYVFDVLGNFLFSIPLGDMEHIFFSKTDKYLVLEDPNDFGTRDLSIYGLSKCDQIVRVRLDDKYLLYAERYFFYTSSESENGDSRYSDIRGVDLEARKDISLFRYDKFENYELVEIRGQTLFARKVLIRYIPPADGWSNRAEERTVLAKVSIPIPFALDKQ